MSFASSVLFDARFTNCLKQRQPFVKCISEKTGATHLKARHCMFHYHAYAKLSWLMTTLYKTMRRLS